MDTEATEPPAPCSSRNGTTLTKQSLRLGDAAATASWKKMRESIVLSKNVSGPAVVVGTSTTLTSVAVNLRFPPTSPGLPQALHPNPKSESGQRQGTRAPSQADTQTCAIAIRRLAPQGQAAKDRSHLTYTTITGAGGGSNPSGYLNAQTTQPGRRTSIRRNMCPVWGIKDAWPTEFVKVEAPQNKTEPSLQAGVAPIKNPKLPEGVGDSKGLAEGAARYTKRDGWRGGSRSKRKL